MAGGPLVVTFGLNDANRAIVAQAWTGRPE